MEFSGSFEIKTSKEKVFDFLTDPKRIVSIVPDIEEYEIIDENTFSVKAKVGISFIKGSMKAKFQIVNKKTNQHAEIIGSGTGVQSSADLKISFDMEEIPQGGVLIKWKIDAIVRGMLATLGGRLIDYAAERYIKQIIDNLRQKLSE